MARDMKAIPTEYRGIRMRSRLEANFAHLFDNLGVDWKYETESVLLPIARKHYRPDFLLPFEYGDVSLEVKPSFAIAIDDRAYEFGVEFGSIKGRDFIVATPDSWMMFNHHAAQVYDDRGQPSHFDAAHALGFGIDQLWSSLNPTSRCSSCGRFTLPSNQNLIGSCRGCGAGFENMFFTSGVWSLFTSSMALDPSSSFLKNCGLEAAR